MTPLEHLQEWIKLAAARKIKIGQRILSADECDLVIEVLQTIAAEMEMD